MPAPNQVALLQKVFAYALGWIGALIATDPTFGLWSLVWMFPLGLFAFVAPEHRQGSGWTVIAIGWMLYLIHAFFYFRSRSRRSSLSLLGLLVLLLLCNISGCREMIHAH
jgi:hypothetical protein